MLNLDGLVNMGWFPPAPQQQQQQQVRRGPWTGKEGCLVAGATAAGTAAGDAEHADAAACTGGEGVGG